jgi:hypothetical protein
MIFGPVEPGTGDVSGPVKPQNRVANESGGKRLNRCGTGKKPVNRPVQRFYLFYFFSNSAKKCLLIFYILRKRKIPNNLFVCLGIKEEAQDISLFILKY